MWALRRASANTTIRAQGLNLAAFRACAGLGSFSSHTPDKSSNSEHRGVMLERWITSNTCQCTVHFPNQFSVGNRCLSSQAGAKSGGEGEDDLEEGFSELETPAASETLAEGDESSDSSSDSDSDLSNVDENAEESLETELMGDAEMDVGGAASKKLGPSPLLKLLLDEPGSSVSGALDRYVAEGKDVSRTEAYQMMLNLRRRKMFLKALQLSEWLEKKEDFDFTERDYASRVDLIAKLRGLDKAEKYIDTIPQAHRQEVVYRTLLANCVSVTNAAKAEETFNKMKDLSFPLTAFACNQLLVLYKRTDKRKIADVLLMMEKEDIKPTLFTYQLLIDTKGIANDMVGMEQILATMLAEGVKPNIRVQATLARHYASGGLKEKAEAVLKEMEGEDPQPWIRPLLLPIYADLGNADEVERIWLLCGSKPRQQDYLAAIEAWGKLKKIDQAEAVFKKMTKSIKNLTARHYSAMLRVYAENKMLNKGKQLLKQMGDSGCHIGPVAWDALVMLYVDAGEVEKADSVLQKATQQNPQRKPLFNSYMAILDQYSKRGDIHNAEKMFHRMRQAGYVSRARPFMALLRAYVNAEVPAYGFRERMKADNIFPNKALAGLLSQADAFKRTAVSDLLD